MHMRGNLTLQTPLVFFTLPSTFEDNPCIDGIKIDARTLDGIQIDFINLRKIVDQEAQALNMVRQDIDIHPRFAANPLQYGVAADTADHSAALGFRQRRQRELNILEDFGVNAAQSKHDQMSEIPFPTGAQDDFNAADHRLKQYALCIFNGEHVIPGPAGIIIIGDTQFYASDIGLMQWSNHFHCQRETNLSAV